MKLYHRGEFSDPEIAMLYLDAKVNYIDYLNSDCFAVVVLYDILVELGYLKSDEVRFFYKLPGHSLDTGLRPIFFDAQVLEVNKLVETEKLIEIYVELFPQTIQV